MSENLIGQKSMDEEVKLNNWQNTGKILNYAVDDGMDIKYLGLYMVLVRNSYGYREHKTKHLPMSYWTNKLGISKPTFMAHIKWLEVNGYIRVITHKGYVVGGGSFPNAYSISLKTAMGYITKPSDDIKPKVYKSKPISKDVEKMYNDVSKELQGHILKELESINKENRTLGLPRANLETWFMNDRDSGQDAYLFDVDKEEYYKVHPDKVKGKSGSGW